MTDTAQDKSIVAREKQEVEAAAEGTRPGRVFAPEVDIFETETGLVLLADMPGVAAGDLRVHLENDVLTIEGEAAPPEGGEEAEVLREYYTGRYRRQFTLSDTIDQAKIEARLKDGVMELTLPKAAKAQPRKITVQAG